MPEKQTADEKKTAAASYIIQFYQEIDALTTNSSIYINLLLELKQKYGVTPEGMDDGDTQTFKQTLQAVRFNIIRTNIQKKSIIKKLKLSDETKADELHDKITDHFKIEKADLLLYAELINDFLLNNIMDSLLQNSQDYLTGLTK